MQYKSSKLFAVIIILGLKEIFMFYNVILFERKGK